MRYRSCHEHDNEGYRVLFDTHKHGNSSESCPVCIIPIVDCDKCDKVDELTASLKSYQVLQEELEKEHSKLQIKYNRLKSENLKLLECFKSLEIEDLLGG